MKRVTGIGGIFFKTKDPGATKAWYEKHLGLNFNGSVFTTLPFVNEDGSAREGYNILSFFKADSDYFSPSRKEVMVNFIVADAFALMATLKEEGVEMAGEPVDGEYGKFFWIMDPEGNKIELWEPPVG